MYFDYAATSMIRKNLIQELMNDIDLYQANTSSIHSKGRDAKIHLDQAREKIAKYIGANMNDVYFTSGATEANNTVINHFAKMGGRIVTTNIEHKSILEPVEKLAGDAIFIPVKEDGKISLEDLKASITEDTRLVAVMYVNNETGIIQPIKEIGQYLEDKDIWFHVDAVQALGHIDIDVNEIKADSLSLSGHKIGGLNGFGVLYTKKNMQPLILGGNQEHGQRAGTSNLLGAVSMANSIELLDEEQDHIKEIKEYFLEGLTDIEHELNGDLEFASNHIVNVYFPFVKSDLLLTFLDLKGVSVSAGSACNANTLEPSYVIENMYDKDRAKRSIRFSFGFSNTKEEVDELISYLKEMRDRKK